jgi:hypothetical protein
MNAQQQTCLAIFPALGAKPRVERVRVLHPLENGGVFAERLDRPDRYHVLPPERVSDGSDIAAKLEKFRQ